MVLQGRHNRMLGKEAHKMIFTPPYHLRKPIHLGFYAEIFSGIQLQC